MKAEDAAEVPGLRIERLRRGRSSGCWLRLKAVDVAEVPDLRIERLRRRAQIAG
jgi:hypothetical protein